MMVNIFRYSSSGSAFAASAPEGNGFFRGLHAAWSLFRSTETISKIFSFKSDIIYEKNPIQMSYMKEIIASMFSDLPIMAGMPVADQTSIPIWWTEKAQPGKA